jgi:hypothetical protein
MKFPIIIAVFLCARLVAASPTEVAPLPTPTTAIENQSRTSLKHRKHPLLYHVFLADVSDIIALNKSLPDGVANASVRKRDVPISSIEREVYTVEGDLWRVKMEDNDDEYHLEISARGAKRTANRIIVEIPPDPGYKATRLKLLSLLPSEYVFKPKTTRDFKQPIPVRVTGYAFFDGHHWSKKSLRGNKHGTAYTATLWEIHPVWKIAPAH